MILQNSMSVQSTHIKDCSSITDCHLGFQQHLQFFNVVWRIFYIVAKESQYTYLDNLLVTGRTIDEHLEQLDHVLHILEMSSLRLNRSKCAFLLPKVEYLGHIIDEFGLHLGPFWVICTWLLSMLTPNG